MTAFVQAAPALETTSPGSMPASYYQRKDEIAKEAQQRQDEQAKRDVETKKWVEQMQAANAAQAANQAARATEAERKPVAKRINQPAILVVGPSDPGFQPDVLYAEPIKAEPIKLPVVKIKPIKPQILPFVVQTPIGKPESLPAVSRIEDSTRAPSSVNSAAPKSSSTSVN